MTDRQDTAVTLPWMRRGTEVLQAAVDSLPDEAFAEPSALPAWSRAHVIGHLARNAEALVRLARWAATGVETPMYSSPEQRVADIEDSSRLARPVLRRQLATTAAELDDHLARLDDRGWQARVRSALGREIPAAELPWMRIREVWLHAVDLDAGVQVHGFPPDLIDALLDDVTGVVGAKCGCPAVDLHTTDRERGWTLGPAGAGQRVSGSAADLAAWVTGRSAGAGLTAEVTLPSLPAWL